jgi:hypothetical protein
MAPSLLLKNLIPRSFNGVVISFMPNKGTRALSLKIELFDKFDN